MSLQPIQRRLDGLTSTWEGDIPTKFLWTIGFQGRRGNGLMQQVADSIERVLYDYQDKRWSLHKGIFDNRSDDDIGFMFAQAVALPQEQVAVGTLPVAKSGGFVAGYYGDRRVDYGSSNKLDVTFLEQNKDIVDMFIRPWLVAVSYHGLIEDETDLKCNIIVNLHTRNPSGPENLEIPFGDARNKRKTYMFEDCVPINVEADQLSYGELSNNDLERTVSFAFSKYSLVD
jgi:hypothetical protein|tara:strand:- start:1850 stop:2536 length:687 start_codon:yes stop_codon:yes gene_type:complete